MDLIHVDSETSTKNPRKSVLKGFLAGFLRGGLFSENLFNWAISSTRKPNDISKCLGYWGAQGLDHLPSIQGSFQGLHDVSFG